MVIATETSSIAKRVADSGGLVKVTLGELRDEMGFSRIGKHVLSAMADHLDRVGLAAFPTGTLDPEENSVPRQWQELWVYRDDNSARAAVFRAMDDPHKEHLIEALNNLEGTKAPDTVDYSKMSAEQRLREMQRILAVDAVPNVPAQKTTRNKTQKKTA